MTNGLNNRQTAEARARILAKLETDDAVECFQTLLNEYHYSYSTFKDNKCKFLIH